MPTHTEHLTGRARTYISRVYTTAHHPHMSSVGTPHLLKVKRVWVISSVPQPSRSLMSFVRFLSSPTASSSRPSASSTSMARSCRKSPSASARWSEPGRMAGSAPNTGYEPKLANFCSNMDPDHTPINIPDSDHNFLYPDDATMIPTSLEGLPNLGASSSSKHTAAASRSMFARIWKQCACHVSGRSGLQETGAVSDREFVATTIFSSQSKGNRDRDTNVVLSLKDEENLQNILERKVDLAVR